MEYGHFIPVENKGLVLPEDRMCQILEEGQRGQQLKRCNEIYEDQDPNPNIISN